jgi:hypothetical protein
MGPVADQDRHLGFGWNDGVHPRLEGWLSNPETEQRLRRLTKVGRRN